MISVWSVLVGALGAIGAIYLKEAVQAAIQRRVIAWQLQGYLIAWQSTLVKNASVYAIYETVKSRTISLNTAAGRGAEAFNTEHGQQSESQKELRNKLKVAITEAVDKAEFQKLGDSAWSAYLAEVGASLTDQRRLMADAKSFISDRDAAMLGKAVAMNVVLFRTSMLYLMFTVEVLLKVLSVRSEQLPVVASNLVDSLVVYGEDAFAAMVRLEVGVERISKRSLFEMTLDILRGR